MQHQDWKPIVINTKQIRSPKKGPTLTEEQVKLLKLENEEYVIPKIPVSLQQKIREARAAKSMTQKELAAKINVGVDIIRGYENGSIVPDTATTRKLSRALGVQIKVK